LFLPSFGCSCNDFLIKLISFYKLKDFEFKLCLFHLSPTSIKKKFVPTREWGIKV